jgi:hypothetical protein
MCDNTFDAHTKLRNLCKKLNAPQRSAAYSIGTAVLRLRNNILFHTLVAQLTSTRKTE